MFCCPYFDNGVFKLLIFSRRKVVQEFNINEAIGINNKTRSNDNFPDPFINAVFISDDKIFVNLYHSQDQVMHHFIYDINENKVSG